MAYTQAQFEAIFQTVTAVSHQIVKIDWEEMRVWVDKIVGPDSVKNPDRMEDLQNLQIAIGAFGKMQDVLRETGIPIRNPIHMIPKEPPGP